MKTQIQKKEILITFAYLSPLIRKVTKLFRPEHHTPRYQQVTKHTRNTRLILKSEFINQKVERVM